MADLNVTNCTASFRPFSGLIHDGRRWRSRFLGDLRDALHWNSLAAILLLYFVTMTLAISLGEELSEFTDDKIVSLLSYLPSFQMFSSGRTRKPDGFWCG